MKRKLVVIVLLTGSLLGLEMPVALADEARPSPEFGRFVSGMAPEHPIEHGAMFGHWVSALAHGSD